MKSDRISLINCDEKLLKTILEGDEKLSSELKINIPNEWSEFGKDIFEYVLDKVKKRPIDTKWFSYLPIEFRTNTLIGSCGYKGAPDENGIVELGYEIAKEYRNQGYATEISKLLVKMAFEDKNVRIIQAHTLPEKNASVSVLKKCGFKFIKEYEEENDGLVWKWLLKK